MTRQTQRGSSGPGLLLCVLLSLPGASAAAQGFPIPGQVAGEEALEVPQIYVELLTIAPGDDPTQKWGHVGVRVHVQERGFDRVYDYGRFKYDWHIVADTLTGHPTYWLGRSRWRRFFAKYGRYQRSIYAQRIELPRGRALALARSLHEGSRREQREFAYDSLLNNCSTRVRDLLDREVFDGALARLSLGPTSQTYRSVSDTYLAEVPKLRWAINLIYGSGADTPIDAWDLLFVPTELLEAVESLRRSGELPPGVALGPVEQRNDYHTPLRPEGQDRGLRYALVFLVLWFLLFVLPARSSARPARLLAGLALWSWTLLGTLLGLVLWMLSSSGGFDYQANLNLFAFHPGLILLPWACARTRRGKPVALNLLVALPLFGLLLMPLVGQASLPYLLPAALVMGAIFRGAHARLY